MRVALLASVSLALVTCSNAGSTEETTAKMSIASSKQVLPARIGNSRLLRTGDSLETEDSEERSPNGWSFKDIKARIPWTETGKAAADAKKAADAAKKLDDIRIARLKAHVDHYLDSKFLAWHSDKKSADDVVAWAKENDIPEAGANNLGAQYSIWLAGIPRPLRKMLSCFRSSSRSLRLSLDRLHESSSCLRLCLNNVRFSFKRLRLGFRRFRQSLSRLRWGHSPRRNCRLLHGLRRSLVYEAPIRE